MKKILIGIVALAMLMAMLIPSAVAAQENCCEYKVGDCCWKMCCAEQTRVYRVGYFEKVPTGIFWHGVEMVAGKWVTTEVEAHNGDEAAEILGLRAGYDCFVGS